MKPEDGSVYTMRKLTHKLMEKRQKYDQNNQAQKKIRRNDLRCEGKQVKESSCMRDGHIVAEVDFSFRGVGGECTFALF